MVQFTPLESHPLEFVIPGSSIIDCIFKFEMHLEELDILFYEILKIELCKNND